MYIMYSICYLFRPNFIRSEDKQCTKLQVATLIEAILIQ